MTEYKNAMAGFDDFFKENKKLFKIPGCSVCVTKGRDVIMSSGFGYKDIKTKEPVDADTQFFLASNTKSFVALSAAVLVDEGKLSWETPIIEYLPWFKMYDEYATTRVSLKDIFSHQTGLPRSSRARIDYKENQSVQEVRKEIVQKIRYIKPTYDIHTKHVYNSLMFTVAAYLIGEVSGMLWEDVVIEKILKPLKMNNTYFNGAKAKRTGNCSEFYYYDECSDTLKKYDHSGGDPEEYNPYGAAGSMTSTAHDMRNYLIMLSNDGVFEGKQIVSKKNLDKIFSSAVAENWGDPFPELGNAAASLGWFAWGYRGRKVKEHGGFYGSMIFICPDEKLGVAVLPNLNYADLKGSMPLVFNILDRMLGLDHIDWNGRYDQYIKQIQERNKGAQEQNMRIEDTKPSHHLDAFCGTYRNDLDGTMVIRQENAALKLEMNYMESYTLKHHHYNVFSIYDEVFDREFFINFHSNLKGQINSMTLEDDDNILIKQEK